MKINTNSWHFNVMLYYRYIRFLKMDSHGRPDSYVRWCNKHDYTNPLWRSYREDVTFEEYKTYSIEAGKLPLDFCTYWRGVLLFPLYHVAVWSVMGLLTLYLLSITNWTSAAVMGGTLFAAAAFLMIVAAIVMYGGKWVTDYLHRRQEDKPADEPGFFDNLKKSVNDHNVCSMVEYEIETKKVDAE